MPASRLSLALRHFPDERHGKRFVHPQTLSNKGLQNDRMVDRLLAQLLTSPIFLIALGFLLFGAIIKRAREQQNALRERERLKRRI